MKRYISRKDFLKTTALTTLSLPLIGISSCTSGKKESTTEKAMETPAAATKKYADHLGLQLYTVREALGTDPRGVLEKIAAIGYKEMEVYDLDTMPELKPVIEDLGMQIVASHTRSGYLTQKWNNDDAPEMSFDEVIATCAKHDIHNVGVAYLQPFERESLDDFKQFAEMANQAGEKTKAAGIQFYYHNHSFEFKPMQGTTPWAEMMKIMDPELVKIELDIFWCQIAGKDPTKLIQKMGNQILALHVKDLKAGTPLDYTTSDVDHEAFQAVGNGVVNIKKVLSAAHEVGIPFAFVEQDHAVDADIFKSIEQSYSFLQGLGI